MNAMVTIAGKEIRESLRNRWIVAMTLLLAVLALSLALLGSAPAGTVEADRLSVTVVSLASLSIFLLPLISLMLSYDAIVGEVERGTLLLVLAYPVSRWQLVLGKFLGHVGVLALATVVGYGVAGLIVGAVIEGVDAGGWRDFGILIATSVLLGAAFIAIGYLLSVVVRERGDRGRPGGRGVAGLRAGVRPGAARRAGHGPRPADRRRVPERRVPAQPSRRVPHPQPDRHAGGWPPVGAWARREPRPVSAAGFCLRSWRPGSSRPWRWRGSFSAGGNCDGKVVGRDRAGPSGDLPACRL